MKNLLIVESPAKAKTIAKYLGSSYQVLASFGHIRDLPSKNGSVDVNNDFNMLYEVSTKSSKHVKEIVEKAKNCDKLILAPDPDREGESIAWHILEVLRSKKAVKSSTKIERVVFNSITKNSILEAIKKPRQIDMDLVNAQQARRALDYLVGFTLSPVLWRKLPGSRSAGRVQSVALRLICDREIEIEEFKSEEYWDIKIDLENSKKLPFQATIFEIEGKKLEKFSIKNQKQSQDLKKQLEEKDYQVLSITKKQSRRKPLPPFITSSLQQEAARKLGFSAKQTMMIAQKLYEGVEIEGSSQGLITYMRTDSVDLSQESIKLIRSKILAEYGEKYLPESANIFKSKVKNAQEAHEAIRPVDFNFEPTRIKKFLDATQFLLYDLIWKRTISSQMADVIFDQVIVEIAANDEKAKNFAKARSVGSSIRFDGFYKIYKEGIDDEKENDETNQILPDFKEKENLDLVEVKPNQHFTEPPPRYSEASLVKKMEELGIGRPSTYAAIISVLQDRGYVRLDKKRFFPEERGRIVTIFLKEFFAKYVEFDYTASLEDELDIISNGKMDWKKFLAKFWQNFNHNIKEVSEKSFPEVLDLMGSKILSQILGKDEANNIKDKCPNCESGKLGLRLGKFGAFIGCSNYPDCKTTMQIFAKESDSEDDQSTDKKAKFEPRSLGIDKKTNAEILVKIGPYGPYLEMSLDQSLQNTNQEIEENSKDKAKKSAKSQEKEKLKKGSKNKEKEAKKSKKTDKKSLQPKPKRISIPKNINPAEITLEQASKLLTLPREVGINPENGMKIIANIGPFGPYLLSDKKFTSVKDDDIMEIGLNRAIDVIKQAEENRAKKAGEKKGAKRFFKRKKS
jgi:DNA topoisomerase-1